MRYDIILLKALLLCHLGSCSINDTCQNDSDCDSWLACSNGLCTACGVVDTICEQGSIGFLNDCCSGTTCEPIPGLNHSRCRPNKNSCSTDLICTGGLRCLFRLGKCALCNPNGEKCTLPYDDLECCSSYCRLGTNNDGSGICADPRHYPATTAKPRKFRYPWLDES